MNERNIWILLYTQMKKKRLKATSLEKQQREEEGSDSLKSVGTESHLQGQEVWWNVRETSNRWEREQRKLLRAAQTTREHRRSLCFHAAVLRLLSTSCAVSFCSFSLVKMSLFHCRTRRRCTLPRRRRKKNWHATSLGMPVNASIASFRSTLESWRFAALIGSGSVHKQICSKYFDRVAPAS